MQPFFALITPLSSGGGPVDPGYNPPGVGGPGSGQPPVAGWPGGWPGLGVGGGPMPGGGWTPGTPPPRPYPGGGVDPGYGIPGGVPGTRPPPGGVDPGYGWTPGAHPSHPIVFPGTPEHPIYYPPDVAPPPIDPGYGIDQGTGWNRPTHPIYNPAHPDHTLPPGGGWMPGSPPPRPRPQPPGVAPGYGIDQGQGVLRPTHPIVIPQPPSKPPEQGGVPIHLPSQDPSEGGWVYAWVPGYGWMWIEVASDPSPPPATTKPSGDKPPTEGQPT
jgi:hypothetical protein